MTNFATWAIGSTVALLMASTAAFADQTYFLIKRSAADAAPFAVTDAVIEKVGTTTFETTLPAMDDEKHKVTGPLMRDLLDHAGISGETAMVVALDKYETDVPVSDFKQYPVIAAVELDGKKLTVRDKGPAWIVYPRSDVKELQDAIYETRSVWQIEEITVK